MPTRREERERKQVKYASGKGWADSGGGYEPTAFKSPEGFERFKLEEGVHEFDVLPYVVGPGNPRADEGFAYWMLEYSVHRVPTPDGNTERYCCLWDMWRETCEICQYRNDRSRPKNETEGLFAQRRLVMYVNDRPGDTRNKIKILDAVYSNRGLGFGQQLQEAIKSSPGSEDTFFQLEGGLTLRVKVKDSKYGSVSRIDLIPRKHKYPDSLMDDLPPLEAGIIKPKHSKLREVLGLIGGNGSDEDDKEERRTSSRDVDDDDDGGKTTATRSRRDDDDEDEEDDDRPTGRAGSAGKQTASAKSRSDDDDDNEPKSRSNGKPPPREKTAKEMGLKVGDIVIHRRLGECEILKISGDGTSLTLEDSKGREHMAIGPEDVKKVPTADKDDDDDQDDAPPPRSQATTRKGGGKGSAPAEDDEDDDDQDQDDEDDDQDVEDQDDDDTDDDADEPAPRRGRSRR